MGKRKLPMIRVKLIEVTQQNYEEIVQLSHMINTAETASQTASSPLQRLINLCQINRMSVKAIKACVNENVSKNLGFQYAAERHMTT